MNLNEAESAEDAVARRKSERLVLKQRQLSKILNSEDPQWDQAKQFLQWRADLNPNSKDPDTGIVTAHMAAYHNARDILQWCIERGACIEATTTTGRTILHHAADGNAVACIEYLVHMGADVNAQTLSCTTALHIACKQNNYEAVCALLCHGGYAVDLDREDSTHRIPELLTSDERIVHEINMHRERCAAAGM